MSEDTGKGGTPGPDPIIEVSEIGDYVRIEYRDMRSRLQIAPLVLLHDCRRLQGKLQGDLRPATR